MFRKSAGKVRFGMVTLAFLVVITLAVVAAPQSWTAACEPAGPICNCPGC